MDNKIIKSYEDYLERLENVIYNHIAIKLATFKGFNESLESDFEKTAKSFPLLYFMVESLQVDCVMTISKLTEENRGDKTIQKFINFSSTNLKKLQKKYPSLNDHIIKDNLHQIENIKEQLKRVLTQRDKYYAHADNEYFLTPNKLLKDFPKTYEDLVDITIVLQNIINKHGLVVNGNWRVCMSDFAYLHTFKTIDMLREASEEWYKKYRPNESF